MSLRELDNIDLAESWVLGLCVEPRLLELKVGFVLLPGHPAYRKPRSGEVESFRKGTLAFGGLDPEEAAVHELKRLGAIVLKGDDSRVAAEGLEGALIELGDDAPEELTTALALYAPGLGASY
jgi:hypothetical protein